MTSRIILLKEENMDAFLPCIMPQIQTKLTKSAVFGFGIVAGELDDPEEPAGAIVCEYDTGVATVLSVGVLPRFQRRGLGSKLVQYMAEACARQHFIELEVGCWSTQDGDSAIEHFFADNGFESLQGEGVRYAVNIGDIAGSTIEQHISAVSSKRYSLSLGDVLAEHPEYKMQFIKNFEMPEDIFEDVDLQTSAVTVKDNRITSAALLSRQQDGEVEVIYLCAQPNDGRTTAMVLFTALGNLYRTVPHDTVVLFTPMGDLVMQLAQRLLEGCKSELLYERRLYRPLLEMWGTMGK
ncbi:MAG: GNAT family N-acetyltransferase [Oscillospiraceae bacterium]